MAQAERTTANSTEAAHAHSRFGSRASVIDEKQRQTMEGMCSEMGLFEGPPVQGAPESTSYCSPALQEIFDRWPSMSEQTCPRAAAGHSASTPQGLDLPQATRKRGSGHAATSDSDSHEEQLPGREPERAPERPASANDLIPPTQEQTPVTPRVKLTTSSVQSPLAAPPLKQSTPSTHPQARPAVTKRPESPLGQHPDGASDSGPKRQEQSSVPNSATPKRPIDQSVGLNRDCAPPPSPRPERPPDVGWPGADQGFTLQLSQDSSLCSPGSFAIIDVASDRRLFEAFVSEWKTKERYSLALACEKRGPRQLPDGDPGKGNSNVLKQRSLRQESTIHSFLNDVRRLVKSDKSVQQSQRFHSSMFLPAEHELQAVDGFPVKERDGPALIGLAVCWGSRDAYYISLQREQSTGIEAGARARR